MSRIWPWSTRPAVLRAVEALDEQAREEVSARAQLAHWKVRAAAAEAELRQRSRAYGRASATIGRLRGDLARAREQLRDRPIDLVPPEVFIERAREYGAELDPVLPPDTATAHDVEQLARTICAADRTLHGLPAWGDLADTGRDDLLALARHILWAGWRRPGTGPAVPQPVLVDRDGDTWLPLADGRYLLTRVGWNGSMNGAIASRGEVEAQLGPVVERVTA